MQRERQRISRYNSARVYERSEPAKKKRSPLALATWLLIVILLAIFTAHFMLDSEAHAQKASDVVKPKAPGPSPVQQAALTSQINTLINANLDLDVAVSLINLNNGQTAQYGVTDPFEAASTAKLITAADYLHHVEKGSATLSEDVDGNTAQQELQQMIVVSDDSAWQNLNDDLGHTDLLSYATSIGLTDYNPDDNTLPAGDIALLLRKLYEGQLLNKIHTQLLLGYMANANYQGYIGAVVPTGAKFYHKAGVLDDRIHDAAIVDDGRHPIVLVIFTKNEDDDYNASPDQTQIIQQIAIDVFNTYSIK